MRAKDSVAAEESLKDKVAEEKRGPGCPHTVVLQYRRRTIVKYWTITGQDDKLCRIRMKHTYGTSWVYAN